MNPNPIFKRFSLKGIGQTLILRQMSMLVICLVVLSLFVLTASAQDPTNDPGVEVCGLAVSPGAVTEKDLVNDSAYLAANPELAVAGRYADVVAKRAEAAYLAANPELLKAHPPVWSLEVICARRLAANPELAIAGRYADMAAKRAAEALSEPIFLAANPELMVARRYPSAIENEVDPDGDIGLLEFFRP